MFDFSNIIENPDTIKYYSKLKNYLKDNDINEELEFLDKILKEKFPNVKHTNSYEE